MKTVVIHPGFLEETKHFIRLKEELESIGYKLLAHACHSEKITNNAVLHVSHSAGVLCAQLEQTTRPKLIVAPPMSRHRIRRVWALKIWGDFRWAVKNRELKFWFYKSALSMVAMFHIRTWRFLTTHMKSYEPDLDEVLNAKNIRVIANTSDPFTESLCDDKRCIVLEGHHDDLLYRPHFYIMHIQEMAKA